jgi:microcystin-dependent protein
VVIQPRLRLLPAPYSFLASQALTAGSVDGGGITAGTVADARLSSNVALRSGGNTFTGKQTVSAPINVNGANVIEFGADTAGKQSDAGKIGYQVFSDGLDIIGSGTSGSNRKVKVWAEGGASFTGPVAATSFAGDGSIPVGGIIMWSGSIANIPAGWALCNGQTVNGNATPDLRDRFLVGAGASYPVGNTGGAAQVTISEAQMPSHTHFYKDGYFVEAYAGVFDPNNGAYKLLPGGGVDDYPDPRITGSHATDDDNNRVYWRGMNTNPTGGNQPQENRPPWYALAYIMRVR